LLISGYRKGLFKVLDAVCILAALSITGWVMLPADLSVLHDYTGASLFTVASYLFFFYVLDAYNIGAEDFKDTTGRVLMRSSTGVSIVRHCCCFSACAFCSASAGVRSTISTSAVLCIKPESCSLGRIAQGRYGKPFPNP